MPTRIPNFGGGSDVRRPIRENILFITNYANFLPGVNYETFYIGVVNTGADKVLFPETFTSSVTSTDGDATSSSFTKEVDLDFDYEIQGERLIGGECQITVKGQNQVGAGDATESFIIAKVVHYDGTTETTMGTAQSTTEATSATFTETIQMTLTNKHFKIGDTLRITLEGWVKSDDAADAANKITVFHDGTNEFGKIPFIRLDEY